MSIILALPAQKLVLNAFTIFTGTTPSNATFTQHTAYVVANGEAAYTSFLNTVAKDIPVATLASNLLTNLGLTSVFTQAAAVAYLNGNLSNLGGAMSAVATATLNYVSNPSFAQNAEMLAAQAAWTSTATNALAYSTASTSTTSGALSTTATGTSFTLTAGTDIAGATNSSQGAIASTFKFTSANETIEAMTASMQAADTLLDATATGDADIINILATGAMNALTAVNIETANVTFASGTPTAVFTNFSGLDAVNITGTVAATVTDAEAAVITLTDYTRVLTINETLIDGTTAAANADVINVTVSGLSHGTTTATRSGVTLTAGTAGTLETLNITSAGTAANDFTLDAGNNVTLSTVNVTGSTAATIRVATGDLTGLTFAAATAGDVTLVVDRTGATTTATNANLWTGVDNLVLIDSATPAVGGDGGSVSGLKVGQKVTFANDFNASVLAFSNATGSTDTATIVLDNATAASDTDVAQINAQNVETLVITSNGFATSTSTTAENLIDDLVGDATTITVNGDTSLDLDLNIDAPTSGSRTVVVDASANTAFVNIEAAAGAGATAAITVSYNITGTAGNDTLALNATGGTLSGGAGNDILTGSALNDTISTGAGTDSVFATTGTDAVTFGDGVDTITFGEASVTAVAQVSVLENSAGVTTATGDSITAVVNGESFTQVFVTNATTTHTTFVTNHAANILARHGVTVTSIDTNTDLQFTGAATGTTFTLQGSVNDAGVIINYVPTAVTTALTGITVATTVTDFATGTVDDIISFDVSEMNAVTGIDTLHDSTGDVVGGDAVVVLTYTAGTAIAATSIDAGANVLKVAFDNTINSAADVLTALDANNITWDGAKAATDAVITTFYDADAGTMVVGFITQDGTDGAVFDDGIAFTQVAVMGMTSAEYTALSASNFSFVA